MTVSDDEWGVISPRFQLKSWWIFQVCTCERSYSTAYRTLPNWTALEPPQPTAHHYIRTMNHEEWQNVELMYHIWDIENKTSETPKLHLAPRRRLCSFWPKSETSSSPLDMVPWEKLLSDLLGTQLLKDLYLQGEVPSNFTKQQNVLKIKIL